MTDYQPLIARAIEGLGKSTGEARRALYERARSALVTQLRSVEPALSESEITRERLSLEEAIRKVEADAARKSRMEARTEPRFEPRPLKPPSRPAPAAMPAPAPPPPPPRAEPPPQPEPLEAQHDEPPQRQDDFDAPAQPEPPPPSPPPRPVPSTARGRLLSARAPSLGREGLKGFRDVVHDVDDLGSASARAAQSARDTRDTYEPQPRRLQRGDDPPPAPYEPELDLDDFGAHDDDARHPQSLEQSFELDEERPLASQPPRGRSPRAPESEDEYEHAAPPRSYVGIIKLVVLACIVGIVAAIFFWQMPNIKRVIAQFGARPPAQTTTPAPAPSEPKFSGRVPQEQTPGQAANSGAPGNQAAPAVAQRVVLYEEDPNDPKGKRFVGSAIWRTETVSPGAGLAPELAVRADIEIPDRRMTVTWSLRRNTDKALPASHTIEIMFNLPADFPGGGIANVPGVLMKQAEEARGTPLAGLAVKVTNGFFLIGLSAVDADRQRNMQLLKDQEWFDVPIVYTNGGRAIMAVEKGPPGDRAFADAFAAWAK
jgi:hypothetical protein